MGSTDRVAAPVGTVYLLHFSRPYRHARHYIGWATDVQARLTLHASGRGARLLQVVAAKGITWTLARTWSGTRSRERQIKRMGGASRRCPMCGVQPAPDQATTRLDPSWSAAYRLRQLTDLWWETTDPEHRARIDAEVDALTATLPHTPLPGVSTLPGLAR